MLVERRKDEEELNQNIWVKHKGRKRIENKP